MNLTEEERLLLKSLVYSAIVDREVVAVDALEDWLKEKLSSIEMEASFDFGLFCPDNISKWVGFIRIDCSREVSSKESDMNILIIRTSWSNLYYRGLLERVEQRSTSFYQSQNWIPQGG